MKARPGGTLRLSLSLPPDLVRYVRAKAEAEGTTVSAQVEKALLLRQAADRTRRHDK